MEELRVLSSSKTAELSSKCNRLNDLIGEKHWLSVGSYKESILRNQLRESIPSNFTVGTGFTLSYQKEPPAGKPVKKISKQVDILVWESARHAPLFRDGEFSIIPAHACRAAVEVKGNLTNKALKEGLENLDSVIISIANCHDQDIRRLFKALYAYELDEDVEFPKALFNKLHQLYSNVLQRLRWSAAVPEARCVLWIDALIVQGHGIVCLQFWEVNNERTPVYIAMKPRNTETLDDTYGFMERQILAGLSASQFSTAIGGYEINVAAEVTRRGFKRLPDHSVMVLGTVPSRIESLGGVTDPKEIARMLYRPRKRRSEAGKTRPHGKVKKT